MSKAPSKTDNIASTPQLLTNDFLEELAKDKKNLVYRYEYDQPQHVISATQRQACIEGIHTAYEEWKKIHHAEYKVLDTQIQFLFEEACELKNKREKTPEEYERLSVVKKELKQLKHKLFSLDEQGRKQIVDSNPLFKKFVDDHEKVVYTLTCHTTTPEHVQHLRYMAYLKVEQEHGNIDAMTAHAMVQEYLVKKFKTDQTLEEYKLQQEANDRNDIEGEK